MAKKIRFPLEMENGVEVRSVEELRDNFSLAKVLEYKNNGKLVTWLRDRYANDIADAVENLSCDEGGEERKICEIFGVPYNDDMAADVEEAAERAERIANLKQYTDDEEYIAQIDNTAFDQDELYDLLDEGKERIYLCGEKFSIPLSQKGVTYIGVNSPTVTIDSKVEVDFDEKNIHLENVKYDEKYQAILDADKKAHATEKKKSYSPGYEIKKFIIPEKDLEKYGIDGGYLTVDEVCENNDGESKVIVQGIAEKGADTSNYDNCIQRNVIDYYEDENKLYILSENMTDTGGFASSIYDKKNEKMEVHSFSVKLHFPHFFSILSVNPGINDISIDNKHILFFGKNEELKWVNFDGTDERTIYKLTDFIYPITIHKGVFYYGKSNRDNNTHTIYSFDVKSGKETVISTSVHGVAYDSQYMYMLEKKTENKCCVHQFHLDSQKQITPWTGVIESAYCLIIQNDYLICDCLGDTKKRIAEIKEPYGIATKEECEKAGFFDTVKASKPDNGGNGFGVKLLENDSLVYWKGDYSENIEIADNCNAYAVKDNDVYYSLNDGTFRKFNVETREDFEFHIKVANEWKKRNEHGFAILDNTLYFRAWDSPLSYDYDKRKKLYSMDLNDKNVKVVPYEFDEEIRSVVNHNGSIYVQEDSRHENIIYRTEAGKWRILLENVEAYCFDGEYIYYVKDNMVYGYGNSYHVFYKMNISSREEKEIYNAKFDTSGVANDGTGPMEKIWIENGKLMYLESNIHIQPKVKEIKL